ncbi:hypothetical protein KNU84_gp016 [Bacteriophage DSS3_VP1]|uniref:Uncharacterized protein n=1 Tax=Bacteriophage DSS3_VP1 TaxID=2664196 RepID=A0A7S5KQ71_9CAUD|nr:hypothetical protein KNU84_gp016 [Bacteriophage DSS3_VP1]QGH74585.1 hypothetical protein DSS3VP1_00016 [Bacteriophage DSS3_VP1]
MAYKWLDYDILAPLTIRSNQTVWTVEKLDKSIDRTTHPSQRWELEFSILNDDGDDRLFWETTTKMGNIRTMMMPSTVHNIGITDKPDATQLKVSTTKPINSQTIAINNTGATPARLRRSGFLQFANHNKVYAFTNSKVLAAGSTNTNMNIFPRLRQSVPAGTNIKVYDDVTFHYYMDDTMMKGITYQDGILSGVDRVALWEAV